MCPRVVSLGTAMSCRIDGGVLVCIVGALNGGIPYNTAFGCDLNRRGTQDNLHFIDLGTEMEQEYAA